MNKPQSIQRFAALVLVAIGLAGAAAALASDQGMLAADQVSEASYYDFMNSYLYTHVGNRRGPSGPDLIPCRNNIQSLMQSYGLSVALEPFTYSGSTYYNVVGTLTGSVYPEREYIIGAHYDSVSNPGADDNASGIALVLECARILSQYDPECTIRFVAFSMEEVGLVGSEAYVAAHSADDIRGMISADMVAYDPSTNYTNIYGRTASNPIKNSLAAAVAEYGDGLLYTIGGDEPYSDHAPFEQDGLQACLLIEGEVWSNPYYHTQQDSFEQAGNLNFPYAVKMTRSVVGWLVDAAGVIVDQDYLSFAHPQGLPELSYPNGTTPVTVEVVEAGVTVLQPGTATLHVDTGSGWQTVPMSETSPMVYTALLPAAMCGDTLAYYFTAEDTLGTVYADPSSAPTSVHTALVAYGQTVYFHDDFEQDLGWTATVSGASSGQWQRGVPVNDPNWDYDPATDGDGSGQCYLTQNQTGNTDVDGGAVVLTSPALDLSVGGVTISYDYYLYLTDSDGGDRLLVQIRDNVGSGPWIEIARHDTDGGLNWRHHEITAAELLAAGVPFTSDMQIRFTANDADTQSIVEAGVDGFTIFGPDCGTPLVLGDVDCDGALGFGDINPFVLALLDPAAYASTYPECDPLRADFSGNGALGFEDINPFVAALTAP